MSEADSAKEEQLRQDGWAARKLLRVARAATLATSAQGQPFAALVTPATTLGGDILLLLSDLSEHTRHLRAEPRCALLVAGEAAEANPQTAPRVSITGSAVLADGDEAMARYLAVHPYAELYAGFGDFHLWRITPVAALFVGGFARATRLRARELLPDPALVRRIVAEAATLMATLGDAPEWLDRVTTRAGLGEGGRLVGIDGDGIDVKLGKRSARVSFSQPLTSNKTLLEHLNKWTN